MKHWLFLIFLTPLLNQLQAATIQNIDITDKCYLHIEYDWGDKIDLEIPQVGQSTEADLDGENIIRMSCESYGGGSVEKTFCIVRKGMVIKKLKVFNQKDPFGDGPACKAE